MPTTRVTLRRLRASDRNDFLELVRTSRKLHRGWVSPPRDAKAFRALVKRSQEPTFRSLLIRRQSDDALVGVFNLSQIFMGPFRSAYLGFYASSALAGQGLMAEGLSLVLRYAFRRLHLHRVEANVQPQNERSVALVRGCGFQLEGFSPRYLKVAGRWRDHQRWTKLADG